MEINMITPSRAFDPSRFRFAIEQRYLLRQPLESQMCVERLAVSPTEELLVPQKHPSGQGI
jgi:hypothetical protein